MSRFTLARDFRNIDPALARIVLIEAGERILATFDPRSSSRATRDLERLGVQVWTGSRVSAVDVEGVEVGEERIAARTVVWAAGVKASEIGGRLAGGEPVALDRQGRGKVNASLQIPGHPSVLVLGDQAHVRGPTGDALPGVAPVAMQQGRYVSRRIRAGVKAADADHPPFVYWDKGQMMLLYNNFLSHLGIHILLVLIGWMSAFLCVHMYIG